MSLLDEIAARADAATEGPWRALGTGAAGGDHWYICDDGEAIASISAQDCINEDQREPDAEFIAHAREDVPKLVEALRAVEAVHVMSCELSVSNCDKGESCPLACCGPCGETWPCPTITAIREALS